MTNGVLNRYGFLINNDHNINEGMELVDRALAANPENYDYLDTKGWGLYKQGKYKEALEMLQKSWDLRMKNAIYNHDSFLHLEAARKATVGNI
jgi:tetratricopeptide (TPR) repeat protein